MRHNSKKTLLQNLIYNTYNQSEFCCGADGTIVGLAQPIELSLEEQTMKKLYEDKYKTSGLSYDNWQKSIEGKKIRETIKKKINNETKKEKWKSFWKSKKGKDVSYALSGVAQGLANEMIKSDETTEEIQDNDFTPKEKKILGMNPITASVIGGIILITGFVIVLVVTRGKKSKK